MSPVESDVAKVAAVFESDHREVSVHMLYTIESECVHRIVQWCEFFVDGAIGAGDGENSFFSRAVHQGKLISVVVDACKELTAVWYDYFFLCDDEFPDHLSDFRRHGEEIGL